MNGTGAFEAHAREVYGWAFRILGHHHDALDVVQDVFLRWQRQCRRDVPDRPRGWLRRATLNRAMDLIRSRESECVKAGRLEPRSSEESEKVEALDREALRVEIQGALSALSDAQRAVLIAKVYDEMTFAQIAEELDVAVPTVKTHYLRAVRSIRDRLGGRWTPEDMR